MDPYWLEILNGLKATALAMLGITPVLYIISGAPFKPYFRLKEQNRLHECDTCGTYRRRYQLQEGKDLGYAHVQNSLLCPNECVAEKEQLHGVESHSSEASKQVHGVMKMAPEEFKWMKYADDFPKLSLREYRRCIKIEKILTKRRRELKAYRTWAANWSKRYDGECPIDEKTAMQTMGGMKFYSILDSDAPITVDSIRRNLDFPKLS